MSKKGALYLNYLYFLVQFLIFIGFLANKQFSFIFSQVGVSIFYLGIVLGEKFTRFKLNNFIRALLIITIVSHNLIGEYYNAYETSLIFDDILHLFGSFSFSLFIYTLLSLCFHLKSTNTVLFVLAITLWGLGLGGLFEIIEFALDTYLGQNQQQGLKDTDMDLFFDLVGSTAAGLFLLLRRKNSHPLD